MNQEVQKLREQLRALEYDALAKSRKYNFQGVSKLFGWT